MTASVRRVSRAQQASGCPTCIPCTHLHPYTHSRERPVTLASEKLIYRSSSECEVWRSSSVRTQEGGHAVHLQKPDDLDPHLDPLLNKDVLVKALSLLNDKLVSDVLAIRAFRLLSPPSTPPPSPPPPPPSAADPLMVSRRMRRTMLLLLFCLPLTRRLTRSAQRLSMRLKTARNLSLKAE